MVDSGDIAPPLDQWAVTQADVSYFGAWHGQMETSLYYLANDTDNYQYYVGEGTVHTVLTDAFATSLEHHPYYDENSAQGVYFSDWMDRLVNSKIFFEENLMYSHMH